MSWLLRRHRRFLASAVLGFWAFTVFLGIANACSWDSVVAVPHQPTVAVHAVSQSADGETAPGHEQSCSNDIPLMGVPGLVQDHPAGQPLILAAHRNLSFPPISAPALRLARAAHPPPGVPLSLRTVRLAL